MWNTKIRFIFESLAYTELSTTEDIFFLGGA